MMRNTSTHVAAIAFACGLLFLGPDRPCHAGGLLQFQFDPNGPTIAAANGTLNYDASTGEFSGSAAPLTLSSTLLPGSGVATFSSDSVLSFDFFVNPDGSFRSDPDGFNLNGTLSIGGDRITGGLLSGDFYAFGAEPAGPPAWVANALADPNGGLLSRYETLVDGSILPPLFPVGGLPMGIDFFVEGVTSGVLGDFSQSFSGYNLKEDVGLASIPEPSSGMMAIIAIMVLSVFRFARKRLAPAS